MGKIKRARKVLHSRAPKRPDVDQDTDMVESVNTTDAANLAETDKMIGSCDVKSGGIFSSVEFSPALLMQELQIPDISDRMSVISSISSKRHFTKKDKRTLKREAFLMKLEATRALKKKMEAAEKKKNAPVVGDMSCLADALPTLEHLMKKGKGPEPKQKPRASKTFKQKKKAMMEDISVFQQVLKHPEYMKDPFGTISAHVKAALEAEKSNCT